MFLSRGDCHFLRKRSTSSNGHYSNMRAGIWTGLGEVVEEAAEEEPGGGACPLWQTRSTRPWVGSRRFERYLGAHVFQHAQFILIEFLRREELSGLLPMKRVHHHKQCTKRKLAKLLRRKALQSWPGTRSSHSTHS